MSTTTTSNYQQQLSELLQAVGVLCTELMEMLIWVSVRVDEQNQHGLDTYGYATQKEIYFLPSAFRLPRKQQLGLLLHEMWHVVLRHVPQARKWRAHPLIANLAMDALINEGLRSGSQLGKLRIELPKGAVLIHTLEQRCQRRLDKPWTQYTWYELYVWLLRHLPRSPDGIAIDPCYIPDELKDELGSGELRLKVPFDQDMVADEKPDDSEDEAEQQLWQERLQRLQGTQLGSWLTHFQGLLPKPKKGFWFKQLRRYLTNWALPFQREVSYSRPHRRFLTKVVPYVMPSERPGRGLIPICVALDTSGSISDQELHEFAAEVDRLRQDFDLEIETWLIQCDADVQDVAKLEPGERLETYLRSHPFKGRGGTSFIPALQKAAELRARLCIYLTDLCGSFGSPPRGMEVIWVVKHNDPVDIPFGKVVRIE
ncbi:MAG: VWA-like domain-containing protein [Gloeomargarita sp. SKYG98]|nr:VWA-like domain-containing protein [Gloeomargarita sp. SKYG98]